ncbi:29885_t:CDS:2 [Gigaspora margarita]|uniref:29885_t:CDS:1 n=1 Tax=Gigaspora margarita TaxID=4874 RepID=A0ABN7UQR0_GIGMA|nr:29885_t:CDS:2 [Gigaspora margarita]
MNERDKALAMKNKLRKGDEPLSAFPIEIKSKATVVEISDGNKDELLSIKLDDKDRLLPTRRLNKYFMEVPAEEHIHRIVSSTGKLRSGQES